MLFHVLPLPPLLSPKGLGSSACPTHGCCLLGSPGRAPTRGAVGAGSPMHSLEASISHPPSIPQGHRDTAREVRGHLNPGSAALAELPQLPVPQCLHLSNADNTPVFKWLF